MISTLILFSASIFSSNTICNIDNSTHYQVQKVCKLIPGQTWGVATLTNKTTIDLQYNYKSDEFEKDMLKKVNLTTYDCIRGLLMSQTIPNAWFEGLKLKSELKLVSYSICTIGNVSLIFIPLNENSHLEGDLKMSSDIILFSQTD